MFPKWDYSINIAIPKWDLKGGEKMLNLRRLRGLRVEHNLTQEEFACWIGMPISTYRKKELGISPIQLEEAYKISQLLGESIEEIFFKNIVPE